MYLICRGGISIDPIFLVTEKVPPCLPPSLIRLLRQDLLGGAAPEINNCRTFRDLAATWRTNERTVERTATRSRSVVGAAVLMLARSPTRLHCTKSRHLPSLPPSLPFPDTARQTDRHRMRKSSRSPRARKLENLSPLPLS